jgi:VIT1/CCC1 family predicted Fe2+/Mn2+ transporter
MPELPSYEDSGATAPHAPIAGGSRRRKALVAAVLVALVVLAAVLHLTGALGGESN